MGRWTVFLYLLIFYGHTTSQPVTEDTENTRPTRQLDFGECCPCPSRDAPHDFTAQESSRVTGEGTFPRALDLDDCPCRDRHPDSEGASSIFFPTSRRSDGPVVRPVEKKEDIKPLLHPEVDLASSVLQTLREATDEEYREALARDAARSKAAEETTFNDVAPEASTGNIVTIIVNPKESDSFDDVIPQESHVQESRCIRGPLGSVKSDFGQMRVASKPPSLLRDFFRLPRINKPSLLHRNLLDMENGASNIQEMVEHIDDGPDPSSSIQGLRKYAPLMKLNSNVQDNPNINSNVNKDLNLRKVPDIKWNMKNKLKDLLSTRSSLGDKDQTSYLPLIPKIRFNHSFSKARGKDIEDLNESPSNIREQSAKTKTLFNKQYKLKNIFEKQRPLGIRNLLKLKDVEFIPLKDIFPKTPESPKFNSPKFIWPTISTKENSLIPKNKNTNTDKEATVTDITDTLPITNTVSTLDHEVSPSNIIEQIHDNECPNEIMNKNVVVDMEGASDKIPSLKIIDTVTSASNMQRSNKDTPTNLSNSESDEFTENNDDCDIKNIPAIETDQPQPKKSPWDNEIQEDNPGEPNSENSNDLIQDSVEEQHNGEPNDVLNEKDCNINYNDVDAMTDSSNIVKNVLELNETIVENSNNLADQSIEIDGSCSQEQEQSLTNGNLDTLQSNPDKKLIRPLSLDETISSIKENIVQKIDKLKNRNAIPKNSNTFDQKLPSNDIRITDDDCRNEESIAITTVKPEFSSDDLENSNESSNNISMQDLQKISDSMLQQEAQERKSKTMDCQLNDMTEPKVSLEVSSKETENINLEESANTKNEVFIDPKYAIDNTCQSGSILPNQAIAQQSDPNSEASDAVYNKLTFNNNIIESPLLKNEVDQSQENNLNLFKSSFPALQGVFKPAPLPTLDDIKLTLTSLFDNDKKARDVEVFSTSEADAMTDSTKLNILNPVMATDASTKNLRTSLPPLRLEDVDLDIFQLKPQSGVLKRIPTIDLHTYKTKLSIPKSLRLKPIKLQSALEDRDSVLGATLTVGHNNLRPGDKNHKILRISENPWENNLNLDDLIDRVRMKSITQNILKTPFELDNLGKNFISQGLDDVSDKLKNKQHTFESKFSKPIKKPAKNLPSHDLIEAISRNHEDVNDKLKALHMDFNDRIETLRNNLFDKSSLGTNEFRNRKTNIKSLNSFTNQNRDKGLSLHTGEPKRVTGRRESKKTLTPRKLENSIGSLPKLSNQKGFKMPAAASVPVPRTIDVPKLKTTLPKSPRILIQQTPGIDSNIRNKESPQAEESTATLWKRANKKLKNINPAAKKISPFKDSKIKVTFSTTPRPTIATRLQSKKILTPTHTNLEKSLGRFQPMEDHNGSPSEMRHSISSPETFSQQNQHHLRNSALDIESRHVGKFYEEPTLAMKRSEKETPEVENKPGKSNELQSWPKVSESAFLSKVKEAVQARLSKINPPIALKQSDAQSNEAKSSFSENEEVLNTDMTRSASENTDIIEGQALQENVSYKCTMVCTKQ